MGLMVTLPERFRVVQPLGEGGMGVVYEVYDEERKQTVALKTIRDAQGDAVHRFEAGVPCAPWASGMPRTGPPSSSGPASVCLGTHSPRS